MVEPLVYTVEDIQILRRCGRDKAYAIARSLPHYTDGKKILVFKEDFDEDFKKIRNEVLEKGEQKTKSKLYQIKRSN